MVDINGSDIPDDASSDVVLTLSTAVEGDVGSADDSDWYKVTLTAGTTYYFTLDGLGGSPLGDPFLALYAEPSEDETVQALQTNDFSGPGNNAFLSYTPTDTATYYIVASGAAWTQGHYRLSSGIMPVDTIPADATTTAQISVGQPVDGIATGRYDEDWYRIALTAGMTYEFTLGGVARDGMPALDGGYFAVVDSDGNIYVTERGYLAGGSFDISDDPDAPDSGTIIFTPAETGTYYVFAGAYSWDGGQESASSGGSYQLQVNEVGADIDAGGPFARTLGDPIASLLAGSHDIDSFNYHLSAGQEYFFALEKDGEAPVKSGTVTIADKTVAINDNSGASAYLFFTAPDDGDYVVSVGGNGTYRLTGQAVPDDAGVTGTTAAGLAIGDKVTGFSENTDDVDWYAVNLVAGQTYRFVSNSSFGPNLTPALSLVTADGDTLASSGNPGPWSSELVYTAVGSDTYFLAAALETLHASTVPYKISAMTVDDAQGATPESSQLLALGEPGYGRGDYGGDGDADWFAVNVEEGRYYDVTRQTIGAWPMQTLDFHVLDSDGNELAHGSWQSAVTLQSPYTGTIYIDVASYGLPDYAVRVTLHDMLAGVEVFGTEGDDILVGDEGNDTIGSAGADTMMGGEGNDVYEVQVAGDVVTELAGQGTDMVYSGMAGYTLPANVENLTLAGGSTLGIGNGLDNLIIGGSNAYESLIGGTGSDTLSGGYGNDLLNGGTGADLMAGGWGNDTYQYGSGDTIIEDENAGIDTVLSAVADYTLGYTLENVTLIGSALNANGNGLNNVMTGNELANVLQGGNGTDTIDGRGGADTINGGGGADVLHGGLGADVFVYRALADSTVAAMDFVDDMIGADRFDFRLIDANVHVAGDQGFNLVGAFTRQEAELVLSYDAESNRTTLMMDANGDAKADMAILLAGHVTSSAGWLM